MTLKEYNLYAQGCALREQITQLPFRRLYQLIYNVNFKNPLHGSAIAQRWPLPDIDKMMIPDEVYMRERMDEALEANRKRKEREKELKRRQENANRGA